MATFEEQLSKSAQRIKHENNKRLRVPQNPTVRKTYINENLKTQKFKNSQTQTYWGWVATPVAAVIGIVFGLSLPKFVNEVEQQVQFVHVHDTIRVPHHTHDTIYQTIVEERERIVWRDREVKKENIASLANNNDIANQDGPQCTSISCDGIDYALFVSR